LKTLDYGGYNMSKSNYTIDSKVVEKATKEAEKVRKIQAQIKKLQSQLVKIEDDNRWLNYTNCGEGLTEDELIAYNKAHHVLNYASRH